MHMRIRYHYLADLHVTRQARETWHRPYAISEHSSFIYHWVFTDGFAQGNPNIDEYFWIRSSEVRNDTESAWIIVEGSRSWTHDFPYVTFSIDFPNIRIKIICLPMLLIHFFCYFGKRRPSPAYAFLNSSLHIPLDTVFNRPNMIK